MRFHPGPGLLRRWTPAAALLTATLILPSAAPAATLSYYLPGDVEYDPAVPLPSEVLGYEVGDWHVRHDQLVEYLRRLAEASPRIQIAETGRTHEERPLLLLTITSPSNLARIEEIRETHARLSDPGASDGVDLGSLPAVCYLGYSVHGNEASGANASMLVAYYLAAARGEAIEDLLRQTVVLLDPALNPDGLARFGEWANAHRGHRPVSDPQSRERDSAWPGGRTNHYWFDLNRDWLLAQHPESQARLRTYHRWKPNVLADFHETGSSNTFFFQPGVPSRRNPLTPERNTQLTHALAAYHARALDRVGSLYFTEELYDDYYYGKGSTYPDINGAIGILFEQATSGGQTIELAQGEMDFPFTIRNQFLVSLSTLQGARDLRMDLLEYQRDFFREAMQHSSAGGWLIGDRRDRSRTAALAELFLRHDIELHELASAVTVEGERYEPGAAFVVPKKQPQARLLEAMMERRSAFPDSVFYDISTWTLPLAMGLPSVDAKDVGDWMGPRLETVPIPLGRVHLAASEAEVPYAFAFEWSEYYAPRALLHLQERGVRARVATRPFSAQTREGRVEFDYGTIVIPTGVQTLGSAALLAELQRVAREDGIEIHAIDSGLTATGIDLGSPNLRPLSPPTVGLLVGQGVSAYSAGTLWHLLDRRFDQPVTLLPAKPYTDAQLERYSHLILPDGGYQELGASGVEAIGRWIQNGGVLVPVGRAVAWAFENNLARGSFRSDSTTANSLTAPRPYIDHGADTGAQRITGAILAARIDRTHPLGYGFPRAEISMFRRSRSFLEPDTNPYGTVVRYSDSPVSSGYVPKADVARLAGSASVVAQRKGQGVVILLVDDPDFRGFWYGTHKLLLNAICFGNIIDRTGE